jgi:ADP-ribosylglycohydrolase
MIGAIAGDIIGSVHEFAENANPDFPLFTDTSSPTDDSLLTCAVAAACLEGKGRYREHLIEAYEAANRVASGVPIGPGWGMGFAAWADARGPSGRDSFGNGSAMRVSAIGWLLDDRDAILAEAERSALPSHAHPEGVRGARCVALGVAAARLTRDPEAVRRVAAEFYGVLPELDAIRRDHRYNETCQGCVPEAVAIACGSPDYESAVRLACSVRGDADTLAAIAGSLAEGLHGVPLAIAREARSRLRRWYPHAGRQLAAAQARLGR